MAQGGLTRVVTKVAKELFEDPKVRAGAARRGIRSEKEMADYLSKQRSSGELDAGKLKQEFTTESVTGRQPTAEEIRGMETRARREAAGEVDERGIPMGKVKAVDPEGLKLLGKIRQKDPGPPGEMSISKQDQDMLKRIQSGEQPASPKTTKLRVKAAGDDGLKAAREADDRAAAAQDRTDLDEEMGRAMAPKKTGTKPSSRKKALVGAGVTGGAIAAGAAATRDGGEKASLAEKLKKPPEPEEVAENTETLNDAATEDLPKLVPGAKLKREQASILRSELVRLKTEHGDIAERAERYSPEKQQEYVENRIKQWEERLPEIKDPEAKENFDEARREYKQLYQEAVRNVGIAQAASIIGQALAQYMAARKAQSIMESGGAPVDASGIKFNSFDWSTQYGRLMDEYKVELGELAARERAFDRRRERVADKKERRATELARTAEKAAGEFEKRREEAKKEKSGVLGRMLKLEDQIRELGATAEYHEEVAAQSDDAAAQKRAEKAARATRKKQEKLGREAQRAREKARIEFEKISDKIQEGDEDDARQDLLDLGVPGKRVDQIYEENFGFWSDDEDEAIKGLETELEYQHVIRETMAENTGASRGQVIEALKRAGVLPDTYTE